MTTRTMPDELIDLIQQAGTVALCCHINPDGDAIGTMLSLYRGLTMLGKQVTPFCQDRVPGVLNMLENWQEVRAEVAPDAHFDLLLCVDISEMARMGSCIELMKHCDHTAQIDHHRSNPGYCEVNVIDSDAPAAGVLAYALLQQLGVALDREMAKCLYAAISTDTGNFAFSSTDAATFGIMAELMEAGLPLTEMNRAIFRVHPACQVKLTGRAMNSLRLYHGGEITTMQLTLRDFDECGALSEHADSLANLALDINGVKMTAMMREVEGGQVKASLRAIDGYDVGSVAGSFGGGGHTLAAGCTLTGSLDECTAQIVAAMEKACEENH